jgi:hypothetical protein
MGAEVIRRDCPLFGTFKGEPNCSRERWFHATLVSSFTRYASISIIGNFDELEGIRRLKLFLCQM